MLVKQSLQSEPWLNAPATRVVMDALIADGGDARFVGGCVRNALLGMPVDDIDIATSLTPGDVIKRAEAKGLRTVATGPDHGTITVISGSMPFEVTTLRRDVSTDGRRATVAFTADWAEDAARRDFTINALYADIHGNVYDYSTGLIDLRAGRVRFIGSADQRIAEDYLRILRLFRIHALYGRDEVDADGLRACADARDHIQSLSGERIQREMLKLLAANEPVAVIRTMAATGVLSQLLPGELLFDRFKAICLTDCDHFFNADAVLRLGALLSDDVSVRKVATRWRLSNEDRDRLIHMHSNGVKIVSYLSIRDVRRALYKVGVAPFKDLVRLRWAEDAKPSNGVQWRTLLALADGWVKPSLPLSGREVMLAGVPHGPLVGRVLSEVEEWWVDSDFTDDPFSIAERLKAVVQAIV